MDKETVLKETSIANNLMVGNIEARGWLLDVLTCVERMPDASFTLAEIYEFEDELSMKHPDNHNVRAKIRQQLQLLRDKGVIEFVQPGKYRKVI